MKVLIFFVVLIVALAYCKINKEALVVLDDLNIRNSHSIFFNTLEKKGWNLHYKEATDADLNLEKYGVYLYDLLILFAPEAEDFGGTLDVNSIINFIDDGKSLVLAANSEMSENYREIAEECGVDFAEKGTFVIDHLNFDVTDFDGDHTLLVVDEVVKEPVITGVVSAPVLFRGVGHVLEEANELLFPLMVGSSTSYAYSLEAPVRQAPHVTGKKTVLVSALQARNNARALFAGSLELFSDKFINSPVQKYSTEPTTKYDVSGNFEFVTNVVSWIMKERGLIEASNIRFTIAGTNSTPAVFSVKQNLTYEVDINEWTGKEWKPYEANDVQFEFVMLDPYIRTVLNYVGNGHFTKTFQIPDVYGIYTLKLNYHRVGYASIEEKRQVVVRPFRHNEFERFIISAYPYYASAFSMMFGVFVFGFVFLYSRDKKAKK